MLSDVWVSRDFIAKILNTILRSSSDQPVRIIHLEDLQDETEIVESLVKRAGVSYVWKWASSREEYIAALNDFSPDIILSDHSMPGFSSVEAYSVLRDMQINIPFILLTATVSEDFAVMMMKQGIADYILKDRPQRLVLAIQNALEKWEAERQNQIFINQLIRSEANLSALMENSHANIYSLDRNFRYLAFNTQLRSTVRQSYGADPKIGDDALAPLNANDQKEWREIYTQVLNGESLRFVKEFQFTRNQTTHISFVVNPIIEGDTITGVACFATDITKEKIGEENLAKSEARFRALIEHNFDSIVLSDNEHRMIYASPSMIRTLGYLPEEVQTTKHYIRFHSDDWGLIKQVYDNAKANPGLPLPVVARVQHRRGHYIWAEGVITNMLQNESVRGIVANFRDVTERKEAELNQAQMTRDLVQRNKDLEQFAYIVSHNLRGPVANILGISHVLKHGRASDADRAVAMEGIYTATSKLDEVILDLNRILDTKKEVNNNKEVVVFQDIVDNITLSIADIIEKNNCRIVTDFKEVNSIRTIRSFLQSIFYNLISNSIKYRQPDNDLVIRISSQQKNGTTKLVFSDNGLGIDLKAQGAKIFGLYRRFHTKHAEGKGMGLFMVKTQVEGLGGEISIKSEVNKGTDFTIDL